MKLHLFISGTMITWKHLLIRNFPEKARFSVPIPFYLLEDEKGLYLFDCGQQPPENPLPENADYIPCVSEEDRAVNLLNEKGFSPEDISGIILSHRHEDHSSGLSDFPHVPCFVRQEELECGSWRKEQNHREWIYPTGIYDLFGDGRVVLLPTPGHTAGHQSLLITLDGGEKILLTADAAYTREALNDIPGENEKNLPYWQSLHSLREYAACGVQIITGHDPVQLKELQNQFV